MRLVIGLIIGIVLTPQTVLAQHAPSDTINVIGRKLEEVRKEAQDFIRRIGITERPVARWVEPICLNVLGVAPDIRKRVASKVLEVARDAGVRTAREPCRPNIVIDFASDSRALMRDVAAKAPNRLREVSHDDRPTLIEGNAPIRWWHATEMRSKDGMRGMDNDAPPFVTLESPGGVPLAGEVHLQYRSSIVSTQMVRVLKASTVVIDVNRAAGIPLDSVAAMAALVSLAEIQPGEAPPANSILSLFGEHGPRDLTSLDTNFLRALYRLPLDRTALAQRGLLLRGLLKPDGKQDN